MRVVKLWILCCFAVLLTAGCQAGDEVEQSVASAVEKSSTDAKQHVTHHQYQPVLFAGRQATAAEKMRCQAVGGSIQRVGMRQAQACVQRYPDADMVCQDDSQCLGRCLTSENVPVNTLTAGRCQVLDSPFGCRQSVKSGVAQAMLCID